MSDDNEEIKVTLRNVERGYGQVEADGERVRVETLTPSIAEKPKDFGVNWPALGTVSPEKTRRFARLLLAAAELADGMKKEATQ